jgi:ATP-dependent DNA helicase RecQ
MVRLNQYLIQLIRGLCEIAFHRNKIRLTSLAVKFYLKEIGTADHSSKKRRKTELKETKSKSAANSLLKHSGDWRYAISKDENVPPMSSLVMLLYGNNKTYER